MRRRAFLGAASVGFAQAQAHKERQQLVPAGIRRGHVMAFDSLRREMLVFGGLTPAESSGIEPLWIHKAGAGWREAVSASSPRSRSLPAGAFDTKRGRFLIYGGLDGAGGTRYGDVWEWNGASWRELRAMQGPLPGPRDHHAMVYDIARDRIVLHGGSVIISKYTAESASNQVNGSTVWYEDTWEFDGVSWKVLPGKGPGTRAHHCMVYDPARKITILAGGISADRQRGAGTWGWDGTSWKLLAEGGPMPRARSRMAFHAPTGEVVLYGGDVPHSGSGFKIVGDTWVWNGQSWVERKPRHSPGDRMMHAMACDEEAGRVVLHGGRFGARDRDDTWIWDGEDWAPMSSG
jgi:hypothetical protein